MCKRIRNHIDEIEICLSEKSEITSTSAHINRFSLKFNSYIKMKFIKGNEWSSRTITVTKNITRMNCGVNKFILWLLELYL